MSRQRDEDIDDDYEVSLGLSDMEKEDAEAIDGLADMLAPMSLAPPPIEENRIVLYRKSKVSKKQLKLKKLIRSKFARKSNKSSASLLPVSTRQ